MNPSSSDSPASGPAASLSFKKALMDHVRAQGGSNAVDTKSLFQNLVKEGLEALLELEMEEHLGYPKYDPDGRGNGNSRNGRTAKTVRGDFGEVAIETPRDRNSSFEPKIVAKRQTSIGNFTDVIISLYARGMTTREIEEHLQQIYGIEVSPEFISRATSQLQQQITEWQNRPLERLYPVVFVDALRVPVRTDKGVVKKCVYTVLGVSCAGKQEVLGLWIADTEGARFWLKVLNDLKARGVDDVLILCGDGLTGLPEAVASVYPATDVHLCVVHQVRNATKFVSYKDRKAFCASMRTIYTAPTIEAAEHALEQFDRGWGKRYPMSVASWRAHWEHLTVFYKYPVELRRIIYTTNAIESLHSQMRKNIANRKVFPHDEAVVKILFLNIRNFSNRWTRRQGWDIVMNQLAMLFPDRLRPEVLDAL
jgi:putative transposase